MMAIAQMERVETMELQPFVLHWIQVEADTVVNQYLRHSDTGNGGDLRHKDGVLAFFCKVSNGSDMQIGALGYGVTLHFSFDFALGF